MPRDTEVDWRMWGASEPWFGVLSSPEYLRENITEEAKARFYEQGQAEIDFVTATLTRSFPPFRPRVGLDFGSGLGRLSLPMATICEKVIGLDISPGMRAEAEKQADLRGVNNVFYYEKMPERETVDWINSYIVLQHIVPRLGYVLLQGLLDVLNKDGFVSIHVTFASENKGMLLRDLAGWRYDGETVAIYESKDYEIGGMSMFDYDMNRILLMFARADIHVMSLVLTNHGGQYGAWIFGRKSA